MSALVKNRQRSGFTLVEVLVAATLTAGLFAGLWTLFGIFITLQERSAEYTARAQITRGLLHQIQDDLNQIVVPPLRRSGSQGIATAQRMDEGTLEARVDNSQPSNAGDQTDSSDPTEADQGDQIGEPVIEKMAFDPARIALMGGDHWMIMDLSPPRYELVQQRNQSIAPGSFVAANDATQSNTRNDRNRVVYYFISPEMALVEDSLPAGLGRWEIPTSTSLEDIVQELNEGNFGTLSSRLWEQLTPASETNGSFATALRSDEGSGGNDPTERFDIPREDIPEIERLLIRYSGDDGWTTSWNSRQLGLPNAIECLVVWRDPRELRDEQTSKAVDDRAITNSNAPTSTKNVAMDPRDQNIGEELDKVRLLAAWERLGSEDFADFPQPLPPGFARYLFCLPSAPIAHRSSLELLDSFSSGASR